MSIENFVEGLKAQLKAAKSEREKSSGSAKAKFTRQINDMEAAITKAARKGIQ